MNNPYERGPVFIASSTQPPAEYIESHIDIFRGVASEVANGDPEKTDELFQEICLRAMEVLAEPDQLEGRRTVRIHEMAHHQELEISVPHVDSIAELDMNFPDPRNTSETVIRSVDNEKYMRTLPKLVKDRSLEILTAKVLDGKTQKELGAEYGVEGSRIGQVVSHSLLRVKHSSLGYSWLKTIVDQN